MSTDTARLDHTTALGTEPIGRLLWRACAQTTMAVGVYGIYALTNAWFVARGVGAVAFAAVNLVAPVLLILGAVATTVGAGGASLVSRSLGRGDPRTAARATGNAFVVFWVTAVAVGIGGVVLIVSECEVDCTIYCTRLHAGLRLFFPVDVRACGFAAAGCV